MRNPQDYSPKERADLLAALSENAGFKLLQAIKQERFAPLARDVLAGLCTDMTDYHKKTAELKAIQIDEEIIKQETLKHRPDEGSPSGSIVGGDSV